MKVIAICESPRARIEDDENVYIVHMTGKEIAHIMGKRSSSPDYRDRAQIKLGMEIDISNVFYGAIDFIADMKNMSSFKKRIAEIGFQIEKIETALHKKNVDMTD